MDEATVVTVFLRNDADVLLLRRSDAVGSYPGRWGAVAGYAEGDPGAAAREEIGEETGIDPEADADLVRAGEPFPVEDADLGTRWVVHPYLFDARTREVVPNEETTAVEWVPPTAILRRETVPELWTSYDRVRPRIETVLADREHGSAYLSVRALEVLRDEAALAVEGRRESDWESLSGLAEALVGARESMPVVRNRVDRAASAAADDRTAAALERAAREGIDRALRADGEAAALAADHLAGARIATLSRSGTVREAVARADPEAVLVAESRPGGEGTAVAGELAFRLDAPVKLTTDAAFGDLLPEWDALVVGADAIFADGLFVNKVGTRGAALAAAHDGLSVAVVAASDKIVAEGSFDPEERPAADLDAPAGVSVANPTFGRTPLSVVDRVVTERGVLDAADVRRIAAAHRELAAWRR